MFQIASKSPHAPTATDKYQKLPAWLNAASERPGEGYEKVGLDCLECVGLTEGKGDKEREYYYDYLSTLKCRQSRLRV